ncbi:hypothetical protein [Shewanella woodyi]|uniref:TRAFAC clade GTPase domain-containing protein n=1 Tax=Shewanella woodyi TaxID=60961 RepID=UPI0009ED5B90|nr:hypothetical protein [Shewanella woodyi]
MKNSELLLLGGPNSGKTHYAGQLFGRLKRRPGALKIRTGDGATVNLSALEDVLIKLEDGNAAEHTSFDQYSEILFPLVDGNNAAIDLYWPDYGGEQLPQIFKQREITADWRKRLQGSEGWLLFIRLSGEKTYPDALSKLATIPTSTPEEPTRPDIWDANVYWIELLQMLCHVAGISLISKDEKPPLTVILSCFDEIIEEEKIPSEALKKKLPLFHSFLQTNWSEEMTSIWGVSSLGKALTPESSDDDFIDDGPEYQGWVIAPDQAEKSHDLTAPLSWILEKI